MFPKIFLDCDGVLADFNAGARLALGTDADDYEKRHSIGGLWKEIRNYRNPQGQGFFRSLPLMADARELFDGVKHLKPTILTGCPFGNWAPPQKLAWAAQHFPGTEMITCMARDKIRHLEHPGDVLVDDKTKFQAIWEEGGGIFVHHTSARDSLAQLRDIHPIWFQRTDRWTPPGVK